jgi:hypothetical protein
VASVNRRALRGLSDNVDEGSLDEAPTGVAFKAMAFSSLIAIVTNDI